MVAADDDIWLALLGRRIVVTRALDQAGPLVERLESLGAVVVTLPLIAIVPPADFGEALRAAIDRLPTYDWVVLTSPNGAARFIEALGIDPVPRIAAIGPGTAEVVRAVGRRVDLVPQRSIGEGLVDMFPKAPETGGRVLLPSAAAARDVVPEGLRAKGWVVDRIDAYRTVAAVAPIEILEELHDVDAIAFTSASTIAGYLGQTWRAEARARVVSIGPATTEAATAGGLRVDMTADPHTLDGLVDALVRTLS